ncbi:MAG: (d)CMP kinase, partial [Vulcanimicrobiota bacterium]
KGEKKDFKEILEIIQMRDKIDSTRTENPLVKTSDAIEVDNTRMSIIEMVDTLENIVRKKIN